MRLEACRNAPMSWSCTGREPKLEHLATERGKGLHQPRASRQRVELERMPWELTEPRVACCTAAGMAPPAARLPSRDRLQPALPSFPGPVQLPTHILLKMW